MATKEYLDTSRDSNLCRIRYYFTYNLTSETPTSVTYSISAVLQCKSSTAGTVITVDGGISDTWMIIASDKDGFYSDTRVIWNGFGSGNVSASKLVTCSAANTWYTAYSFSAKSLTIPKGSAVQSLKLNMDADALVNSSPWPTAYLAYNDTVLVSNIAKRSYTVAYNANGGSGAPANQSKVYGDTLVLSTTRPTRSGYSFKCWNDYPDGDGVDYYPGGNYTANAALTLYAVWEQLPNVTSVEAMRVGSDVTSSDPIGGKMKVSFSWSNTADSTGNLPTFLITAVPSVSTLPTLSVSYPNSEGLYAGSDYVVLGEPETYMGVTVYRQVRPDVVYTVTVTGTNQYGSASRSYALEAATEDQYSKPAVTVTSSRTTSAKTHDICGEYVYLTASYASSTELYDFVASFENGTGTNFTYDPLEKTGDVLLGPYTSEQLRPENAYTASVSISDKFYTTVVSKSIPRESTYVLPTVSITRVDRVASDGVTPDALGGYVRISGTYTMTQTITNAVPSASRSLLSDTPNGSPITEGSNVVNTTARTFSRVFGEFPLATLHPDSAYYVTSTVSDRFNTAQVISMLPNSTTQQGGYFYPLISEVNPYRIGNDLMESDDGTDFRIDVNWSIYSSMTQTEPETFNVRIVNESGLEVFDHDYDYSVTSGHPSIIYIRAEEGEDPLFSQDLQYTVIVTLTDRYSLASLSAVVTSAFFTLDVKRGGHGIAFGKPSTRQVMDVRFPGYFDQALHIAEQLSLPVYFRSKAPRNVLPSLPALVVAFEDSSPVLYLASEGSGISGEPSESEMHTCSVNYDGVNDRWDAPDYGAAFEWPVYSHSTFDPGWYDSHDPNSLSAGVLSEVNPHWWTSVKLPAADGYEVYSVVDAYLETDDGSILQFVPEEGNSLDDYVFELNSGNIPANQSGLDLDLDTTAKYFHFKHYDGCGWHPGASSGSISGAFHVVYETVPVPEPDPEEQTEP